MSTNFLLKEVKELGKDVLYSSDFQEAVLQEHHFTSTVARHSLVVALIALSMCYTLARIGIQVNKREVVIASLAHDLGILGRKTKYSFGLQCAYQHPRDSEKVLRKMMPDLSEKTYKAVRWHMFPVFSPLALSWIGLIVTIADKRASFMDRKKNEQ